MKEKLVEFNNKGKFSEYQKLIYCLEKKSIKISNISSHDLELENGWTSS